MFEDTTFMGDGGRAGERNGGKREEGAGRRSRRSRSRKSKASEYE